MKHNIKEVPNMEGIGYCTVCNGAEGTCPTHCPGFKLNTYILDAIYYGGLDFKDGAWTVKP